MRFCGMYYVCMYMYIVFNLEGNCRPTLFGMNSHAHGRIIGVQVGGKRVTVDRSITSHQDGCMYMYMYEGNLCLFVVVSPNYRK